ncbi:hypothetical protein F4X33_08810 [Candidatus Poribacteria bacterium]|nr:hypothetical protein [Candidatus Poribacteria bacterium]
MRTIILVACLWIATSPLWGQIALHSKRTGTYQIYTMNADGSNQTQITFGEDRPAYPIWSPNGQQIVFTRFVGGDANGNEEVFVMGADGTKQHNLSNHPRFDSLPDWSPDGEQIVFVSGRNRNVHKEIGSNLFVMSPDGENIKQITHLKWAGAPRWSPDGKRIAFETDDFEIERQVYVVDADGRKPWRVSSPKANTAMFLGGWSPDGKQILYREAIESRSDKSRPVIATLDLVRREVIRWKRVPVPKGTFSTSDFSADGQSILFSSQQNGDDSDEIYRFVLASRQLIQLTNSPGRDAGPHQWNSRLSVSPQELTPTLWGEIKATK